MHLIIAFCVASFVSVVLLTTLPLLKKWFINIEIFLLFLFTSYFCQNTFYLLSSPYDRISVVQEHFPFWTVRLQYGIVFAVTLMWVMAAYRSKASLIMKLSVTFAWMLLGILAEKLYLEIGVLRSDSVSWYPSLDLFFEMLVILITLSFVNFAHKVLRKERVI